EAERTVDVESERGELSGHVRVEPLGVDAVEDAHIVGGRRRSRVAVVHAVAEKIERGGNTLSVERADGGDGVVERFASDESRGRAARETSATNVAKQSRVIREVQEGTAEHGVRVLSYEL